MSTIWTPGGERPVPRPEPEAPPERGADPATTGPRPSRRAAAAGGPLTPEEAEAELAQLQRQLMETPAAVVIANHCFGIFELAALHLGVQPPQLGEAQLAIDALGAIVDALAGRLGEHESQLREAVASLRLAFVQIRAENLGAAPPPPSA